jgi:hypothetical protein
MTEVNSARKRLAYGLAELSGATGLSLGLLRREVKDGNLRARRVRRRLLVTSEDWSAYLSLRIEPKLKPAVVEK